MPSASQPRPLRSSRGPNHRRSATPAASATTSDRGWCSRYHARDEAWFSRVAYWRTPERDCGDARGSVCKDWDDWVDAWDEVSD